MPRRHLELTIPQMIALRRELMSLQEIARLAHTDHKNVSRWIMQEIGREETDAIADRARKAAVKVRVASMKKRAKRLADTNKTMIAGILEARRRPLKLEDVARLFKVAKGDIVTILRQNMDRAEAERIEFALRNTKTKGLHSGPHRVLTMQWAPPYVEDEQCSGEM